jgi:hypothetical protein
MMPIQAPLDIYSLPPARPQTWGRERPGRMDRQEVIVRRLPCATALAWIRRRTWYVPEWAHWFRGLAGPLRWAVPELRGHP